MRKRSKRYKNLLESLKKKEYKNLDQIIKELKNGSGVKFVESIDLSLKINLKKIKGAENSLRTLVELPHGNGKKIKVAVLCDENKLEDAKLKFEKDLVFNPKSESSYLYLSKIFNKQDKKKLEEQNLNTVILLNPKNEEAIYNLAKLKLKSSDYKKSKELNIKLKSICSKFCQKSDTLKIEIENLSKK